MTYFLDTNICIYYLNGKYASIRNRIETESIENIKLPSVVVAELYYGVSKSQRTAYNVHRFESFASNFEIVPFTVAEAKLSGEIRALLESAGEQIGYNDVFIAATALAHGATLVTHNTKEFSRVPHLAIEDWAVLPLPIT